MSKVIFSKCDNYTTDMVYCSISEIAVSANLEKIVKKGERILIKPNLLLGSKPDEAITSHPVVVDAIVKIVKELGAIPILADSPGGSVRSTLDIYEKTGMMDICRQNNIEFVSFETLPIDSFPLSDGEILHVTHFLNDIDGIISIGKLKTHSLMLMTLGVKSLYGLVPGFRKGEYHKIYPTPSKFAWMLSELYERVKYKLKFVFIDGVVGMDGDGPSGGNPRQIGIIAGSEDAPAMDSVIEKYVGLVKDTPLSNEMRLRGHLPEKPSVILLDDSIEPIKNFKFPSIFLKEFAPSWAGKLLGNFVQIYPGVDEKTCIKCGQCMRSCPVKAIEMVNKSFPKFNYKICIRCLCCHEICPIKAITFRKTFLLRKIVG